MGMFLEYDWTFDCWRVRFNRHFIAFRGERSFATKKDAVEALRLGGCQLTQKTDSRSYRIEVINPSPWQPAEIPADGYDRVQKCADDI